MLKFRSCQSDTTACGEIQRIWGTFGMFELSSTCLPFLQWDLWGLKADHPQYLGQYVEIVIVGFSLIFFNMASLSSTPKFGAIFSSTRGQIWVYFVVTPNLLHFWWSDCVRGCRNPRPTNTQPSGKKSFRKTRNEPEKMHRRIPRSKLESVFLKWLMTHELALPRVD